jgi:S1-C subfamily serine protease
MEDIQILEAVERYIRGEMKPDERVYFEQLRKTNPEIDQLVVEHTIFIHQMNEVGELRNFRSAMNEVHTDLAEKGLINSAKLQGKAKIIYLWNRYKRVAAIAATIAGITTLTVSLLVNTLAPKADSSKVQELGMKVSILERNDRMLNQQLNDVKSDINSKVQPGAQVKGGGTGFLIDSKGYIITNAHIVKNGKNIIVFNNKGQQFIASIIKLDAKKDIAILKIKDEDYKPYISLPYSFKRNTTELAEKIYTLGYPKNEIVYNEGYMSASNGYDNDTLTCQLGIAVNEGNSGGPVLNHQGEVIGILSAKETEAEGVAFAIQSKYLLDIVDELKKEDTAYQRIKLPARTTLSGMNQQQQVKRVADCVFMIRTY